ELEMGTRVTADARHALVAAKESLSFRADASMPMRIDDEDVDLRLTRFELDAVAAALVERTADTLELALDSAQVQTSELDEIVLIGGASRTPLIAQKVSERFDRPITAADDPQFTAGLGAASAAWTRLQEQHPAVVEEPSPPAAVVSARRDRPRPGRLLRRLPYGAAAALAAGAVLVAAGVVFGTATPVAEGTGSAQDPASETDGDGFTRLARTGSGYSTAVVVGTDQATGADAPLQDRDDADARHKDGTDNRIREPKPRTPQPPESSTTTPSSKPSRSTTPHSTTPSSTTPSSGSTDGTAPSG